MKPQKSLDPIHPGEILLEDFLKPLGIGINQLARDLDVPPNRIGAIVNGARSITADTALRLGTHFGVSPETWLGLQIEYDLRLAQPELARGRRSIRDLPFYGMWEDRAEIGDGVDYVNRLRDEGMREPL